MVFVHENFDIWLNNPDHSAEKHENASRANKNALNRFFGNVAGDLAEWPRLN